MKLTRIALCLAVAFAFAGANRSSAAEIRLPRHPDYFEGKIVFSYLGDLWLVNDDGANPRRLTTHAARDAHPKFSPDGKWIAFSSNRFGNNDVFVMPAAGGTAKRLTFNSTGDTVAGWSRDGKRVTFSSARGRVYGGIPSLYEVSIDGGAETPMITDWGTYASYSPDGKQLAFNRHPTPWSRKHYRGSYSADLWLADLDNKTFKKMLDADLPDEQKPNNMWPMFANDAIYFVSDRATVAKAGSPEVMKSVNNIWKLPLNGSPPTQVTQHTSGSLFWPSISADGKTIVYEENFGLWKLDLNNGKPVEVKIDIVADERENNFETRTINGEADAYHLSPSGKRAVISVEGELFTIATDRGEAARICSTPGSRDVSPQWSPDGKTIAFISDSSGREEIWTCDESGQSLKKISDSDTVKGTPIWSPDSKALLYSASDKKLHKYTLENGQTEAIASGEVVGGGGMAISQPQWSPDGKWVSFTRSDRTLLPHVFIMPATGGDAKRVTGPDSYSDNSAFWTPDGKKLVFMSGSDVGNIGAPGRSTAQLYAVSLAQEEKDPSDRGIDNEAAAIASAETERPQRGPRGGDGAAPASKPEVRIDFDNMPRRIRQLTRSGDTIQGGAIAPDSKSFVFVTSGVEGGRNVTSIWQFTFEGERTTRLTQSTSQADEEGGPPRRGGGGGQGFSSLQFAKDGRTLFYRQGRNIYALSVGGGGGSTGSAPASVAASARRGSGAPSTSATPETPSGTARQVNFTCKVEIDHAARRKQVFNEAWRVMKTRFYDPDMHGVDWNRMKSMYEPLLNHIAEQDDLNDVVNMMIGELNASHTGHSGGGRARGQGGDAGDSTRNPGFDLEPADGLYRVSHIYRNGPADKDYVKIKVGDYILAIDGKDLKAGENYWKHFTLMPGSRLEFTVNSKPNKDGAWTTKVTPTSNIANLQYQRWVDERRALVDKLSNGEIGYLHIRQMNEPSLRQFERDLGMVRNKKALVIDQRFNPGGNIDQELLEILGQKQYQYTKQRDSVVVQRPLNGFFGPKVVMENERSTSDAEVFPDGFRTLKMGKVIGVTTYGAVIGTGSYSMMDGSSIRTPGSGLWNVNGQNLENYGVPPDVYIDNTPGDFLQGRDAQIEKAVEVLKEEMAKAKNGR